jgi:gliding motility-associated-like protein
MTALRRFLSVFLTLLSVCAFAQEIDWVFSTTGESIERTISIAHDASDGSIYGVGLFEDELSSAVLSESGTLSSMEINLNGSGDTDGLLYKLNASGELQWYVTCNGGGEDSFLTCAVRRGGNVVVGGFIEKEAVLKTPFEDHNIVVDNDSRLHALTAVFSPEGELLLLNVSNIEQQNSAIVDIVYGDDAYYRLMLYESDLSYTANAVYPHNRQYLLTKYDLLGNEHWSVELGASGNTIDFNDLQGMHPRLDFFNGKIAVIGYFNSGNFFIDHEAGTDDFTWSSDLGNDIFTALFNDDGSLVWARPILQSFDETFGFDIALSCDAVYVIGTLHATTFFPASLPGGFTLTGSLHDDIFVARLSLDQGLTDWAFLMPVAGADHLDRGYAIDTDANGNVIFGGELHDTVLLPDLDPISITDSNSDAFVLGIDPNGNGLWVELLEGEGNDVIFDVLSVAPDQVLIGGEGSVAFSVLSNVDLSVQNNAVIASLTVPAHGTADCCVIPDLGVLTASATDVCPGEDVLLQLSELRPGAVIEYSASGVDYDELMAVSDTELTLTDVSQGWYRVALPTLYCGTYTSNEVFISATDTTPPQLVCAMPIEGSISIECGEGIPDLTTLCNATDACSSVTMSQSMPVGTALDQGSHSVSVSATDAFGNQAETVYTILVEDNAPPVIDCADDQTIELTHQCKYILEDFTDEVNATDNCGEVTVLQTPAAGLEFAPGVHVVSIEVWDEAGNASTCSFQVEVIDLYPPVLNCPEDLTVAAQDDCSYPLPSFAGTVLLAEDCGQTYTIAQSPLPATPLSVGTHSIELTVTDADGNQSVCSFTMTVADEDPPFIICSLPSTIELTDECTYALPDFTGSCSFNDNCGVVVMGQTPIPGTPFEPGEHEVLFTAQDAAGNTVTEEFIIEVIDATVPVVDCPGAIELNVSSSCTYPLPDLTSEVAVSGTCADVTIMQSPAPGTPLSMGAHEVTFTAVAANGQSSSCELTYLLVDNEAPAITCPDDQQLNTDDSCVAALPDYTTSVLTTDGCESVSVVQIPAAGELLTPGLYTVEINAEDESGNVQSCSFEVVVSDTTPPSLACDWTDFDHEVTDCTYALPDLTDFCSFTDACGAVSLSQDPLAGTLLEVGVHEVTLTATDETGLTTSLTQEWTITDDTAPELLCTSLIESCDPVVSFALPEAFDNCSVASVEQLNPEFTSGSTFPPGTTEIFFEAIDQYGNSAVCTTTVVIHPLPEGGFSQSDWQLCTNDAPVNLAAEMLTSDEVTEWGGLSDAGWFDPQQNGEGVFTISAVLSNGLCDAVKTADVTVYPTPEVNLTTASEVCGMNTEVQGATTAENFYWEVDEELLLLNGQSTSGVAISADSYGTHWVMLKATASTGCYAYDTTWVTFVEPPSALNLGDDIELDAPREVYIEAAFDAGAELTFNWITGDASLNTTEWPWSIHPFSEGQHILEVIQSQPPCPQQRDTLMINILDLLIPSGFSPNGDLVNDRFEIRGIERFDQVKLQVFDRNGHLVYAEENYANVWDGLDQRGRMLPADTYYAVVTFDDRSIETYIVLRRE